MNIQEKEARAAIEERVRDLVEQQVDVARLAAAAQRYGRELAPEVLFEEDLGMDFVDLLYFLADLTDCFGVPMHVRSLWKIRTLDDAFHLAWAQRPDLFWEPEIGGEG